MIGGQTSSYLEEEYSEVKSSVNAFLYGKFQFLSQIHEYHLPCRILGGQIHCEQIDHSESSLWICFHLLPTPPPLLFHK